MTLPTSPTLYALLIATLLSGCNTSGMSGSGKSSSKKSTSEKSEESSLGTEEAGNKKVRDELGDDGLAEETADQEDPDDTRAIPPEVVSGAYLTCTAHRGTARDQTSRLLYGCAAFDSSNNRLPLGNAVTDFELKNGSGGKVDGTRLDPPDNRYDLLWDVHERIDLSKLNPRACIQTTDGELHWLERDANVCAATATTGLPNFRVCVDMSTNVCMACGEGTISWNAMPGVTSQSYKLLKYSVDQNTGLCTGSPTELSYTYLPQQNGLLRASFNNNATSDFCLGMSVTMPLGRVIWGGILD